MKREMSKYEYQQVSKFLYRLYILWGENLDEEECMGEGWLVYWEGRKKYRYDIGDYEYWEYVQKNVKERLRKIRKIRNEKMKQVSKFSIYSKIGENETEVLSMIPSKTGDFVNSIALWDYVKSLGECKYNILRLMYGGEDDIDIMRILHLSGEEFYTAKVELREDFEVYEKM